MLRVSIVTCLMAILHFPTCSSQGVPWSAQDQDIIFWKLKRICEYSDYKEYLKLYPNYEYVRDTQLNFPKVLRLAFHDCLKYNVSDLEEGQINGCDGCLEPTGMNINMNDEYGKNEAPDIHATNNNGLTFTADILEEVYTNPNFPSKAPALDKSMKEKGMSRADLWAFASLIALKIGVNNNNKACQGKLSGMKGQVERVTGHMRDDDPNCQIDWKAKMPVFKTGRKDCTPAPNAGKPWHASKHEIHPDPHGNGPITVDFYR